MAGPFDPGLRAVPDDASSEGAGSPDLHTGPTRLVVVDSETAFTTVVARRAKALGWEGRILASVPGAEELAAFRPDAVVLAAESSPDGPWEAIADLAVALPECGVIVVAAQSTVAQRVRALRLGADDWLNKPVHPEELVARVQAVIRRRRAFGAGAETEPIVAGELRIRPDRFQAYVGEISAELTRREYELLELLARADGRVLEREEIYLRVWGYSMAHGDRSVDVFVRKLRTKLGSVSPGWRYVHTHFGVGYRFESEPAPDHG